MSTYMMKLGQFRGIVCHLKNGKSSEAHRRDTKKILNSSWQGHGITHHSHTWARNIENNLLIGPARAYERKLIWKPKGKNVWIISTMMTTCLKEHIPSAVEEKMKAIENSISAQKTTKGESVARKINCIFFFYSFRGRIGSFPSADSSVGVLCAVCVCVSNCVACPKRPSMSNHSSPTTYLLYTQFIRIQSNPKMGKVCSFPHRPWFQDNIFISASVRKWKY